MDEQMARKRILVDTSMLIDHLRKKRKEKSLFYQLSDQFVYEISVVTEFEFRIGCTKRNRDFTETLLSAIQVLPFDSQCAKVAVQLYTDLKSMNKLIDMPDIFIAATALANDLPLLTLNKKHFERVKNLNLI
jgi:predicted nucleic acid-binding protein